MSYKCMNGLAPPYLCELFNKRVQLHYRVTRNKEHYIFRSATPHQVRGVSDLEVLDSGIT